MEILSPEEAKEAMLNDSICKKLGTAIYRALPDRNWFVRVKDYGRIAFITIPELSTEHGMVVHLSGSIAADERQCINSASEMLERFGLTRGRSDNHDLMSLDRNLKGVIGAKKGEL